MKDVNIIPLFVIIPLLTAFLIALLGKTIKNFSEKIIVASSSLLLAFSLYSQILLRHTPLKTLVYNVGGWLPPFGISMVLDGLSSFMLIVVNLIAFFVAVYSLSYMEKYTDKPKFFTLFALMVSGLNGVIVTGDIFNLFVFLEIASIASYALVAFGTQAEELEASFKYTIMGTVASSFIFLGIVFLYGFASTLNMAHMASVLNSKLSIWLLPFVSVLFLAGFSLKAAMVPFHGWLPDAHSSAPASISAMLSGVLIKTLGIYAMMRIFFNVLGITQAQLSILMFLGSLSIITGAILAFSQWDFKRLLAYSTISQVGYIVLGLGLGTPLGIFGALFHLFNHSVFKSLLFLNSGAVDYAASTRDLRETGGLNKVMPVTTKTNFIASMSISGIPPFSGFFSKLIIIFACIQKGHIGYGLCAVIGSILTLIYFMKLQKFVFLGELKDKFKQIAEVPYLMRFSMICLAAICILAGFLLLPALRPFLDRASDVLLGGTNYAAAVMGAALR
ncbi:MAG: proton-conducting transporter membrane subunit [Candidatus Omnitrophica bacterium]|nr:proton-conducting transporter membrane subunit [Candidatus Omnitrophota bacterium]MDD5236620.1 proton-conducting transporter membrane subunit [Candidatus Omnitrophota bacterium]MDD5609991.1 proton-conducting transporter membrane subunit [Candidatus Omnitrophota bacterium]